MFKLFAGLFAGPGSVLAEWFTSIAGKIIGTLALLSLLMAGGMTLYFSWENTVKAAEDAKFQLAAAQSAIKDRDLQIKNLKAIQDLTNKSTVDHNTAVSDIDLSSAAVSAWLQSQGAAQDRPSSAILTDTLDKLYGKRK